MPGVGDSDVSRAGSLGTVVRYALISDVHANLPALEAVLKEIDAEGDLVDAIYHLGDLVGYAPWPNEVVERLRQRGIPGVAGNYDSTVASDYKHCGCRYEDARQEELSHVSFGWTRDHVSTETKRWLGGLPFRIDVRPRGGHVSGPCVTLLHGSGVLNTVYVHADRSDEFLERMAASVNAAEGDVICFGHTHTPWHRLVRGVHFVNAGSVGRPKDGDPRAAWILLDMTDEDPSISIRRVAYDVESAARGIVHAGLPEDFADALRTGGASATNR
jgi:predicted phosphodiesterase